MKQTQNVLKFNNSLIYLKIDYLDKLEHVFLSLRGLCFWHCPNKASTLSRKGLTWVDATLTWGVAIKTP